MTFIHYTNSLSAHQLPLDRELIKLVGAENFRYVYTNEFLQGGAQEVKVEEPWIVDASKTDVSALLESCDVLLVGGLRPIDLMERRLKQKKNTLYMSERWFKPIFSLPGWVRLFVPSYWWMVRRFVKLFDSPNYRYLPIGPHATRDMRLILSVFRPFQFSLNRQTAVAFLPWSDFVTPSNLRSSHSPTTTTSNHNSPSLLWLGRLLDWKCVDTIIRAVKAINERSVKLTVVGKGPEEGRLKQLVEKLNLEDRVTFRPAVSLAEARELMRKHDIFVLASNAQEGWGCVVNEALEEGMMVLGTYEAGASAAILPKGQLFHSGDYRDLAKKIQRLIEKGPVLSSLPYEFTPQGGAEKLMKLIDDVRK